MVSVNIFSCHHLSVLICCVRRFGPDSVSLRNMNKIKNQQRHLESVVTTQSNAAVNTCHMLLPTCDFLCYTGINKVFGKCNYV